MQSDIVGNTQSMIAKIAIVMKLDGSNWSSQCNGRLSNMGDDFRRIYYAYKNYPEFLKAK